MSSDVSSGSDSQSDAFEEEEDRLDFLQDRIVQLEVAYDRRGDDIEELQETVEEQQERIAELENRTDLLRFVERVDDVDATTRRGALLLHMKSMADKRARNDKKRSYTVTQAKADEALHGPDIDRTTFYTDFRKIEEWVGNKNVCKYISDTGGESRLELDLSKQSLINQDHRGMPDEVRHKLNGGA